MATAAYAMPQYRPNYYSGYGLDEFGNPVDPNAPATDQGNAAFNPQSEMASPASAPLYGTPSTSSIPDVNLDPDQDIHTGFYQDMGQIQAGGKQINQEAIDQLNHYGPRQENYEGLSDTALQELKGTPGYTGEEAGQINQDYSKYRTSDSDLGKQFLSPEEQASITGNPNDPRNVNNEGTAAEGAQLNAYGANVGNQLTDYQKNLGGQVENYQKGVGGAVSGLKSGLESSVGGLGSQLDAAQGKFGKLDSAVGDPSLAFDPNSTEKQLTDADVQEMKTAAGTRIGNQYRTAQDQLERNAAAAGNTSPLAIAAANARLQTQEASDQGNAETAADIAAKQAQYERASGIEGQRYGESANTQGMRAGAATTEEAAAQQAAGLAGTQGITAAGLAGTSDIAAQEALNQAGINASNSYNTAALAGIKDYGTTAVNTASDMAGKNYNAANTAEQTAAQRANALATNRQGTQANVSNTQYGQGMATGQATAGGAKTVGDARMTGLQNYRTGLAGQQGAAQQGGQNAIDEQQKAFATQTQGINDATKNRANYEVGGTGNSALNQAVRVAGTVLGGGHADGAIVDKPEVATVGERGPELILPLIPPYRRRMAA